MIGETTFKKPGLTPEMLWDVAYYKEAGLYFYLEATQDILPNGRVVVENRGEMIMLGSYSYLGLIGHPEINVAAKAAVDVIEAEPRRVKKLQENYTHFANRLRQAGFDLLFTETAIVPVICGSTNRAASLAKYCQDHGIFVQAVVAPVVPEGLARLRACVSAAHRLADIDYCADTIIAGGRLLGIIQ